jgi:hypothetical protein
VTAARTEEVVGPPGHELVVRARHGEDNVVTRAVYSPDGRYRYSLSWAWDMGAPCAVWIMLNPSTATEEKLDPTVNRCLRWTKAWGGGMMVVLNLFAFRSSNPTILRAVPDPIGPENDRWTDSVLEALEDHDPGVRVVAGWGGGGRYLNRGAHVIDRLTAHGVTLWAMGENRDGTPVHPGPRTTWLRPDAQPELYREAVR